MATIFCPEKTSRILSTSSKSQELKKRLAGLSEEQRLALLKKIRKQAADGVKKSKSIGKAEPLSVERRKNPNGDWVEAKLYEASVAEEGMVFLSDYFVGQPVYTSPMAFHLTGQLDADLLEDAFNVLVARHGVLRSYYQYAESGVVRCEFTKARLGLIRRSFEGPVGEGRKKAKAYAQKHAKKAFDTSAELPIAVHYLKIGSEESVVIIILSHIVSDGWSRSNFCNELCNVYAQLENEGQVRREANELQMADFSNWQKIAFQSSDKTEHLNYWRKRFKETPTPVDLPIDFPRSKEVTCNGDSLELELGDELIDSLRRVATENGATLFMVALAAFKTLLLGYAGQKDMVVGTPTANRPRPEFEPMIGCFINTLAIRTEADDRLSFLQYLEQIKARCVEAYHHEAVPYSEIASELDLDRSEGDSTVFKTIFALQDFPDVTLRFDAMVCTDWGVRTQTAKVEIYLNLEKLNGNWISILEYNTDLFSSESMELFSRNWKNLLETIAAQPDQPLSDLSSLPEWGRNNSAQDQALNTELPDNSLMQETTSCFVMGNGRIIVDAVKILRGEGFDVRGILSTDKSVLSWAKKEKIDCSRSDGELEAFLSEEPFDYLFSINNPKVLTETIFSIPVKCAINFHDAPLPRYGGVNALYWAIINRETSWAVTWHVIDHQIDTGPIIKQIPVEIQEDDTVITLGLRCTETGLDGLKKLIPELQKDKFLIVEQNSEERSYNDRMKRESPGGVMDWSKSAEALEAEHRALRFGPVYNPIQCLKVILGDSVVLPSHVSVVSNSADEDFGTVLEITDTAITIQASGGSLCLEGLSDMEGREVSPRQFEELGSIKKGDPLKLLSQNEKQRLQKLEQISIRGEYFWRKRLSGLLPVSFQKELKSSKGQTQEFEMRSLAVDHISLSRSSGQFADPILIAAWGAFIGRVLNESQFDIVLVPNAKNLHGDIEKSMFSEALPFRILLKDGEPISSLTERIDRRLKLREKLPLISKDLLIRHPHLSNVKAEGDLDGLPLGIVFCDDEEEEIEISGFQAVLRVVRNAGIDFVWDRSVLNDEQVNGVASAFETFLEHFLQNPNGLLDNLPLVDKARGAEVIELGRGDEVDPSCLVPAHQMFEEHVFDRPNEIAIQQGDETQTFSELNERANILAHHLVSIGIGSEKKVGILMERSINSVVSILAVLKAGGAYVPLDVAYPEERLQMMISDADLVAIITQSGLKIHLPKSVEVVAIDQIQDSARAADSGSNLQLEVKPDQLAYVIFTSGSSGKPKGVQIEHRSLSNYALAASEEYGIGKEDRVLQFASLSFDSSVEEIFCTLCSGARLVLRTDSTISSFSSFVSDCDRWAVTIIPLPTAFWHSLVAHWKIDSFIFPESVKTVILGGEAMSSNHLSTWNDLVGKKVRLINGYGPTEVTVVATTFDVTGFDNTAGTMIPIGRPLAGYETYIVDRFLNLLPPGVEGELCVGGLGLARGYLNQPEETRQRFISSPFEDCQAARLYRTGDRVVQLRCGRIVFLGRIDEQLKVRGFRLEPKEIEDKLCNMPGIKECAVTALQSPNGQNKLVAYFVPVDLEGSPDSEAIQVHMKACLPEYMVPQQFVKLEQIPLTANGKVDFKNIAKELPVTAAETLGQSQPLTEGQRVMIAVWKELFEHVDFGLDDSFFKVGGHSLLATQLISRLHTRYSREVSIRDIFDYQTIRALTNKYPYQKSVVAVDGEEAKDSGRDDVTLLDDLRAIPENAKVLKDFRVIFSDILDKEDVSPETDFFQSGGNSLSANFMIIQAREAFDIELSMIEVFENPTLVELGDLILVKTGKVSEDELKEAARVFSEAGDFDDTTDVHRNDGPRSYPLSFAQQRLWFLDRFKGSSAEYNLGRMYPLKGKLNKSAMAKAINTIVARHDSLRTCFKETYSGATQVIHPEVEIPLKEMDLRDLSEKEQKDLIREEYSKPFDLEKLPLVRSTVYQLAEDRHIVEIVIHHIVTDGWSVAVMNRELTELYSAFCDGKELSLPPLATQYPDYSKWQRDWLQGEVLDAQLQYWTEHLKGVGNLDLPTDRPRPPIHTYNGASLVAKLPKSLGDKMMQFNRSARVTPFMSFLTAFQVLLAKHSGQEDVVVGTPIANRQKVDHEKLIGFFVNTLVMRMTLEEDASFNDLVKQVRMNSLNAFQNQDLPFERLVEAINPKRDQSRHPVFQVMFALQNAHGEDPVFKDLEEFEYKVGSSTTHFDLELHVMNKAGEWVAVLLYNTDLFDEATIQRLFDSYVNLLDALTANPEMPVRKLTLLGNEERDKLLSEWNDVPACPGSDTLVQTRFEDVSRKHPDMTAVCYADQSISYGELNRKANLLAETLRKRGVTKNVPVAIWCERSVDSVLALLATAKAGGVCMPLDSSYPSDRIHGMIKDAQPAVIIAHESLVERLPADAENVLVVDHENLTGTATDLSSINETEDVAYLLYTSGSTGKPKGVEVPHRTLSNLIAWQIQDSDCGPGDATLQFASFNFDVSFQEVFSTLCSGGRLIVVPETLRQDLFGLGEFIIREDPKRIFLPFVALDALAQSLAKLEPGQLTAKEIITAGEQLKVTPSIRDFFKKLDGAVLLNHYGPTETHVVTSERLDGDPDHWPVLPSIGKPIPGARIYIVDENLEPVQIGFPGQLLVGGLPVAKGYLNDSEKTAEKFIASPWVEEERVYCTGDLARYANSGSIEFLGRTDDQVKIRGFRVELGEIESALVQHDSIRECAVSVYETSQGLKQLAAYCVKQEKQDKLEESELKSFLKGRLPEYMIPSAFVDMEELPLSPNRKIDRKALPKPVTSKRKSNSVQPHHSDLERVLTAIWCKVLGLENTNRTDNFFDVGGHSLLAIQLHARIRQYLDVDLVLKDLFENPSIKDLANLLRDQINTKTLSEIGEIEDFDTELGEIPGNWFLASSQQKQLWFVDQFRGQNHEHAFQQTYEIRGGLDTENLKNAFMRILERHAIFRTSFVSKGAQIYQVVEETVALDFQVSNLRFRQAAVIEEELEKERMLPFDLTQPSLVRARLFVTGENEHLFAFSVHPIVADQWSVRLILRELETIYNAAIKGESPPLNVVQSSYSDYSVKQGVEPQTKDYDESLNYWSEKLSNYEPLEIPIDHHRPEDISNNEHVHEFALDPRIVEEWRDFGHGGNGSHHTVFLASFIVLLARYSRQKDILIGMPVADRSERAFDSVVGPCVNTPVLRVDLGEDPNFYSLLKRVSNELTESTRNRSIPFEKIVEIVNPPRDTSRHPIFQVAYSLEVGGGRDLQFDGADVKSIYYKPDVSHLDLCMEIDLEGETPSVRLVYNADLFRTETIERMGRHYLGVLKSLTEHSKESVTTVHYLSNREQEFILGCGMGPSKSIPANKCLHHLFEEQVSQNPEKIAVRTGDVALSYRMVNARANHLASVLIGKGIKPGSIVGLHMEASAELLACLLAILKAGCTYLPLNPALPEKRLVTVLTESGLTCLMTDSVHKAKFKDADCKLLLVDEHEGENDSLEMAPSISWDSAAYILYTSGSTGIPKGTTVNHRSIVNLIEHGISRPGINSRDAFLSVASPSFDTSLFEMFGPLSAGAELIISTSDQRTDVMSLVALLEQHSVTVMHATPSLWKVLVAAGWKGKSTLKILTGGEKLSSELAQDLLDRSGALWNLYGPTETTIFSTANHVKSRTDVSLGYPIANTELYVVDEYLNLVPEGICGELLIGGMGVATGYYGDETLSDEKFISNPFSSVPGSRVFKTGDLCRWSSSGKLEYLERIDDQVKVNGFRIELGDIESHLIKFPGIDDCAVRAWPEKLKGHNLVAYVISSNAGVSADEMIAYLETRLPDYMVPSCVEFVDELPYTSSGKIDRKALNYPKGAEGVAPHEDLPSMEHAIATIWADLLDIEYPDRNKDFFDLGGHSLIAFQVIIRTKESLGIELSLRDLFDYSTVSGLAAFVMSSIYPDEVVPSGDTVAVEDGQLQEIELEAPVSFAQSRIWFLEQLEEDMVAYNLFGGAKVEGPFEPEIFRRTLQAIVERQSAYRTVYRLDEGEPVQVVKTAHRIDLPIDDLSHLSNEEQEKEVDRRLKKESSTPFDLENDLMIRASVLKLGEETHVLMINQHHIATDGWSTRLLWRELAEIYTAYAAGEPSPLPDLQSSYAKFSIDQRELLQGEYWDSLLNFWKTELDGIRPLELPTDRPRPYRLSQDGGSEFLALDHTQVRRLREFCVKKGSTMHMMVMSVFQILLARLSGQKDIVVGLPSVSRNSPELEDIIGVFLSTLLVRGNLEEGLTFSDFLNQIRFKSLEALDNSDMPFESLVEELAPERDLSRNPLFQVLVNSQESGEGSGLKIPGLEFSWIGKDRVDTKFDLTLYTTLGKESANFRIVYSKDLFDASRIQNMFKQLVSLFEQIIENPDKSIWEYSLVTDKQRELWPLATQPLLLEEQKSVVQSMIDFADQSPSHPAISWDGKRWTYKELKDSALHIASSLCSEGFSEGSRVVVDIDRSFGCIASFFGVLAMGGVVAPFDPDLPVERKRKMLQQISADAIIRSSREGKEGYTDGSEIKVLVIGEDTGVFEGLDVKDSSVLFEPDFESPAYIFFTSGTTGEPKGILGRYAGLNHFINWQRKEFEVGREDRASQLTSLSFDVCLRDIFLPLSSGATLCLPPKDMSPLSGEALDWLKDEQISILHTVPSILNSWIQTRISSDPLEDLRVTFSAGEPLKSDLIEQWRVVSPETEIVNLYGPTETTLAKCFYRVPQEPPVGVQPIGTALPGTDVGIMSEAGVEAGVGEVGEIVIRTPYSSLGYLKEEQANGAAFIADPWRTYSDVPVYRSGDLGRLRPDGNIDILGRIDDQIKIRGIRIEPKEVESCVESHPLVKNCRVLGKEDSVEGKMLIAYVVKEGALSRADLSEFLGEKLSQSMIPRSFVFMDEIPLTVNGKLDKSALPEPDLLEADVGITFVEPRTSLEEMLAEIFVELLKVEKVGVHDNFFHLGGNSLLIVRLCFKVGERLDKKLQVASIFKFPTIAQLAEHLGDEESQKNYSMLLNEESEGTPIFFIPGISRNAMVHLEMSKQLGLKRPCYGLELPVPDNGVEPLKTMEELAEHCVQEIKKIQPEGPYTLGGFSFGGILAYEVAVQLHKLDGQVHRLFMFDSRHRVKNQDESALVKREKWFKTMFDTYRWKFLRYFFKNLFQHHVLWKLGLWDGFNERDEDFRAVIDSGLPFIRSNDYHYAYKPSSIPLNLTVFTVRQFLFTRQGQRDLFRWNNYVKSPIDYVLVDTDNHIRIMDDENLDAMCERMRADIAKDTNSI